MVVDNKKTTSAESNRRDAEFLTCYTGVKEVALFLLIVQGSARYAGEPFSSEMVNSQSKT